MRFAFLVTPHLGGTYTVFASLRDGLRQHGITLRWVGLGPAATAVLRDDAWAREWSHGEAVDPPNAGEGAQGRALVDHLVGHGYDGVFVNVLTGPVETNAVRYLPPHLRRIMIVHNITPGTYAAARAMLPFVHAAIGVSERITADLRGSAGIEPERIVAIPNAVDTHRFAAAARSPRTGPLRLLSLGRVEDLSKGVFWLPEILKRLAGEPVRLTVAGDGPDLPALEKRLALQPAAAATCLGRVAVEEVPALCARHDVFVMPSRFEGFGQTIVEAMAAGCVPVVSRIAGVTDRIVRDQVDGLLFPVADVAAAAAAVRRLIHEPGLLPRLAEAGRTHAATAFGLERQAGAYAALIRQVMAMPEDRARSLAGTAWSCPTGLRRSLRSRLPKGLKNLLRTLDERARTLQVAQGPARWRMARSE